MQADGGLVQNVQHPHQRGADLCGQPDALGLAAGKGARAAGEGQVRKPHVLQKLQPGIDLLQNLPGDEGLFFRQLQVFQKLPCGGNGQIAELGDVHAPDGDGQHLPLQPLPAAFRTGSVAHEGFVHGLHGIGTGLPIAPLQTGDNALEGRGKGARAALPAVGNLQLFPPSAVEQLVQRVLGDFRNGLIQRKSVFFRHGLQIHLQHGIAVAAVPSGHVNGPFVQRLGGVGNHQRRVDLHQYAQSGTGGTGSVGIVEGEHPWREFLNGHVAVRAGVILGKQCVAHVLHRGHHQPAGKAHGGFQGIRQPGFNALPQHQPVYHDFDGVLLVFIDLRQFAQFVDFPVDPGAHIALPGKILQKPGVFALSRPHHRRQNLNAAALGISENLVHNLIHRLLADFPAAYGAVGNADAGV